MKRYTEGDSVFGYVFEALIRGDVHMDKLAINESGVSTRTRPDSPPARREDWYAGSRHKPKSGDRIKFVYIVNKMRRRCRATGLRPPILS
jgi:hypothetical protein